MSVSFGTFRKAVREPEFRAGPAGSNDAPITPNSTFRKAISVYHDTESEEEAINALSLTSDYWRDNARGRTLASNYMQGLRRYFALDGADGRRTFDSGVRTKVQIEGFELNLYIDALVYDLFGHAARICLWDVALPSEQQAAIMAAPVALGLRKVVGEERAQEVAFWHLRTGMQFPVAVSDALSELPAATEALTRASSDESE